MTASAALRTSDDSDNATSLADRVAALSRAELNPIALEIDEGTIYPDQALRNFGKIGAWSAHGDLRDTVAGISAIGESCGATAFMAWCQNTLVWYIINSPNAALKARFAAKAASGELLGGTGLSNPMKSFFGIEKLKLKGRRVEGGYTVRGALPWVSNLGPDHMFGTIFELEDGSNEKVMFLADCADENVTLTPCKPFLAMDGTGTYAVQFRDSFIPDDQVLAAPAMPFVRNIRAGFILMQNGMGLGLMRDCVAIMQGRAALARARQLLPAAATGGFRRTARQTRIRDQHPCCHALSTPAIRLLATRGRAAAAHRRCQRRRRTRRDAALWRARLSEIAPRPTAPARSVLRGDRHTRHQATQKNARRQCARTSGRPDLVTNDTSTSSTQWRLAWLKF